jgi:hypothetical protein
MRGFISIALMLGLLSGLRVPPVRAQEPASPPNSATIYFYRLRDAYGAVLRPSVYCDKVQIARMRNGRFLALPVPPGKHMVTSTFAGNGLEIEVKPGESYYFRVEMTRATMFKNARGEVTMVAPEQGKFEVQQLKPAEAEDLKKD